MTVKINPLIPFENSKESEIVTLIVYHSTNKCGTKLPLDVKLVEKNYIWTEAMPAFNLSPISKLEQKRNMICWDRSNARRRHINRTSDKYNYFYVNQTINADGHVRPFKRVEVEVIEKVRAYPSSMDKIVGM